MKKIKKRMSLPKQLLIFFGTCFLCALLYAGFNMLVDPFGVFGDAFFDYYAYNLTQNPRVAKIAYLDQHHAEYDSYIFGCSKTSSYPVSELNKYLDANFYNMFAYGGDLYDIEKMASYVLDHYQVKNLVLAMGPEAAYLYNRESDPLKDNLHCKVDADINPLLFYAKYFFLHPAYAMDKLQAYAEKDSIYDENGIFDVQTGAYNKLKRDAVQISDLEQYYKTMEGSMFEITHTRKLSHIDEVVACVASIKARCDALGIRFILIGSPMYDAEIACYAQEEIEQLCEKLCEITEFYNFWGYNTFSHDVRYFYDGYHFRNCVGSAALARIFENEQVYVPADFGRLSTCENIQEQFVQMFDANASADVLAKRVPILMYHALTEDPAQVSDTVISVDTFTSQMQAIAQAGYTALFYDDLRAFVQQGTQLPEKSILITFDDGYESNLSLAAPVLEKYGLRATISVIGVSVGKDTYKDTQQKIYPHFALEQALPYISTGVVDIQSHTYDMHNNELDADFRDGVLPKQGESQAAYAKALRDDFSRSKEQIETACHTEVFVITYPFGKYTQNSEMVLMQSGAQVSVGVENGINELLKGNPNSLRQLHRYHVTEALTPQALLAVLEEYR